MLNFLRKSMQKFKKIPDRSVKIQLWRRRRRLYFLRKIGGGSADRFTPLSIFFTFFQNMLNFTASHFFEPSIEKNRYFLKKKNVIP
jgi:hypothetical protein